MVVATKQRRPAHVSGPCKPARASVLALCTIALAMSATVDAQAPGRIAAMTLTGEVLEIDRNGVITTLMSPPAQPVVGLDVVNDVPNRSIAFLEFLLTSANGSVALVTGVGANATTLATITGQTTPFLGPEGNVVLDQDGDYIVFSSFGVHRVTPTGTITTIDPTPAGGGCERLVGGGWYAYGAGQMRSISRGGVVTGLGPVPGLIPFGELASDPRTGDAIYAGGDLLRFSDAQQAFSTLTVAGTAPYVCAEVDMRSGDIWAGRVLGEIHRVARSGAVVSTLVNRTTPATDFMGLTEIGSHHLGGLTPALAGATHQLHVAFPSYPGASYAVGASFGFRPGIPTPAGPIAIVPDALFAASQALPQLFTGFLGTLSARGEAFPAIRLPGGTQGVRFYVAAIAVQSGRIVQVSRPLGVTIQ